MLVVRKARSKHFHRDQGRVLLFLLAKQVRYDAQRMSYSKEDTFQVDVLELYKAIQ